MVFCRLPVLCWIAFSSSLKVPEKYANESFVPILEKYARSVHLIDQSDQSLGIVLENGMNMLFLHERKYYNYESINVGMSVNLGLDHFEPDYLEIPHIIEHIINMERPSSEAGETLYAFCKMHNIHVDATTFGENTLYNFNVKNSSLVEELIDKLTNNMFNLLIKKEMVYREYKLVTEEFFLNMPVYHKWLLDDDGNYIYKPLREHLIMKVDIDLAESFWNTLSLTNRVISAYGKYYKPKFMNLVIRGSSEAWLKHIGHFVGKLGPILNNDEDVEAPTIFPHDVQSPNIFARIISEEAPNLIVAWNYPCHKKYERLSSVQLMEFLLASTFLVKAPDENLVTWFLKMRLEVRPDIIISMADDNVNYCQMHIEIILKEKGLKEHQYVLKLLANHLENLQNYPGAEWEKIYNRMDYKEHPHGRYTIAEYVDSIHNFGLEKCVAALKEKNCTSDINLLRSNIRFLRQHENISLFERCQNFTYSLMPFPYTTMESLMESSEENIIPPSPNAAHYSSRLGTCGNLNKKCPSNIEKWIPISFYGDSMGQFGYCSQKFDHLNISFITEAMDFNDQNQLLNAVYIQLLLDANEELISINKLANGFSVQMHKSSFKKLAQTWGMHDWPHQNYVNACKKVSFIKAACKDSIQRDVTQFIHNFYSHAKPYITANGKIESEAVEHCGTEEMEDLLHAPEWRVIGASDKFTTKWNGSTNYVNITSSNGLRNLAAIAFFFPRNVLSYNKKRFVEEVLHAFTMDDLRARRGLGYDVQASFIDKADSNFFMITVPGLTHSPIELEGYIMEMFSFLGVSIEKVLGKHYPVEIKQEFKRLLQVYFNPESIDTNRIVIHCHGGQQHSKKQFLRSLVEKK